MPVLFENRRSTYRDLRTRLDALLEGETDWIALLATFVCELHSTFDHFDWTGVYRASPNHVLIIGPYQGTHGCLRIPFDRGICGRAARMRSTQLVPNVAKDADHIACSSTTQSEIVVPVLSTDGELLAVLDVDSNTEAAFTEVDREELEWLTSNLGARWRKP